VKGTWSKSFRAPSLIDLNDGLPQGAALNPSQISSVNDSTVAGGRSNVLLYSGKNSKLQEETADIWTAGVQFAPVSMPRLQVGVTYFDIDFTNRIETFPGATSGVLSNTQAAYAVNRNFTAADRQAVCSSTSFVALSGNCLTTPIVAIVDGRLNNTASVRTNGLDLLGTYGLDTGVGSFDFGVNATYLLEFSRAVTTSAPLVDLVDTPNNPPDLRGRVSLGWRRGSFASTLFVNYTGGYRDTISTDKKRTIDSWTTLDLNLSYSFERLQNPALSGTQIFLSAQNVLDEDAPFYNNAAGVGYDPDNADVIGRRVSLFLRKEW
jgi:hypothetical protein